MKRILITGARSYVGTNFEKYLKQWSEDYYVETIDMLDSSWHKKDFSSYDVVYHVAGIAHSDNGKISSEKEKLYRDVNTELTLQVASKAKIDGVKQFIFMSSAIVYGDSSSIGKTKMITRETQPNPNNCYSDSKWQAELGLKEISDDNFKVCVLRPPMIYGRESKGNYQTLAKLARVLPIFPQIYNIRSMIYIENLCEFVRLMIENKESGVFLPQNKEYSNTTEMVQMIAAAHGKKVIVTKAFNWGLYILKHCTSLVDKAFGSLAYDQDVSRYKQEYRLFSLEESIKKTEE